MPGDEMMDIGAADSRQDSLVASEFLFGLRDLYRQLKVQ